jgi:hypothetical protein
VTDYDDDDKKADGSEMEYVKTVGRSVKRQVQPRTDHFERLLEEACLNHAYHIKHKLKDCSMMKNFMTSGSLTQDREHEEDPGRRDATPFPREGAVMTVYNGRQPPGRHCISNLSLGTSASCIQGPGNIGM